MVQSIVTEYVHTAVRIKRKTGFTTQEEEHACYEV